MKNNKKDNIDELLDNLEIARIIAGYEFEKFCNEDNDFEAIIMQNIRDNIENNINTLKSYKSVKF